MKLLWDGKGEKGNRGNLQNLNVNEMKQNVTYRSLSGLYFVRPIWHVFGAEDSPCFMKRVYHMKNIRNSILVSVAFFSLAFAGPAIAGNVSHTSQTGAGNAAGTFQNGNNLSLTGQFGFGNTAITAQNGANFSATGQLGFGNFSTTTQNGANSSVTLQSSF
jgi:hypothetical protein